MQLLYVDSEKRQLTLYSREGRVPIMTLSYWLEDGQEQFYLQMEDVGVELLLCEDEATTATWKNASETVSLTLERGEQFRALYVRAYDEQHVITYSLTS